MSGAADQVHLRDRVAQTTWYHTIELAPGVITPGYFDTRGALADVPLPESLGRKRCLDVGTYDGFWAFEMEKRGAAEVVAVDVLDSRRWDWPVAATAETIAEMVAVKADSRGFEIAREALGSAVERVDMTVYEIDRERLGGFDFVYVGSLLLHLRDPVGALERIRAVCDGELLLVDAIDARLSRITRRPAASLDGIGRPWWWRPNLAGLIRMVVAAGFDVTEGPRRFRMRYGAGGPKIRQPPRRLLRAQGRGVALEALRGDPHAAVLARPVKSP